MVTNRGLRSMQAGSSVTGTTGPTDWHTVNWRRAYRQVRHLRQRIFRAAQRQDWKAVRSLQRLMLRSRANALVSVRRVTQLNQGRTTAGVDKLVVNTPAARGKLVDHVLGYQPWRASPVKRVYIPKANATLRPLGIPTVLDRVLQARVKNALEPAWEARFEGSSYGFRPGRSGHDAIEKIYQLARPNKRKKWVIDADIKGAFDTIDHGFLLRTIGDVPGKELIRQWLKAGYLEGGVVHDTDAGTPQGGVASPLLANIALHGMEAALGVKHDCRGQICGDRAVVRYADDFVVFCESREDAERAITTLRGWLKERGLALSEEKTRIVHLTEGFDFLGFHVRHYADPTRPTGYKLLIKPSTAAVRRIKDKLRAQWQGMQGANTRAVLTALNPLIRGWATYYRPVVASQTFRHLDNFMYRRTVRYAKHTHPNKPWGWLKNHYWGKLHPQRDDRWVFGDKDTRGYLLKFAWFGIKRHVLVKGTASPDDPRLKDYWATRGAAKTDVLPPKLQRQARSQRHRCPLCGESLHTSEAIQEHHIRPRREGGPDTGNVVLLHLYCHQQVTNIGEEHFVDLLEPYAGKLARTVLRGAGG